MRRWLPWLVAVNGLVVLINLAMTAYGALAHRWTALLSLVAAAVGEAAIVYIIHTYRRTKPSSPSQQPTSSTSPSQSPSVSPSQIAFPSLSLSASSPQSLSPNEPKFQPEKRSIPVVGFRAWRVSEGFKLGVGPIGEMGAINASYGNWHPGVNVARCFAMIFDYGVFTTAASLRVGTAMPSLPAHSAPDPNCTCGFYVLTDLDRVPYSWHHPAGLTQGVVGAVVGWGRVVQHGDEGWRAEKVQVIAFLDCKISAEHLELTERMAAHYGVPVVGRKALELLAAEYGERLQ